MKSSNDCETNVGIDTGQDTLDISVRPQGDFQSFGNNAEGIQAAIRFIRQFKPDRVLIEATGRLEMDFFCAAYKARLPVCVCNPILVREILQAFILSGQVGEKTVDADAIKFAHHLHREAAHLVGFVEERRDDQQAPLALLIERNQQFLLGRAFCSGGGPGRDHWGGAIGGKFNSR